VAYHWNWFAVPWLLVGAVLFMLAGVIYSRQRASRVATLFCLMISLVGAWFFSFAAMYLSTVAYNATIWARLGMIAVSFLPASIYDFTATALRRYSKRKRLVVTVWLIAAAFAGVNALSGVIIPGVELHSWGYYPVAGPAIAPFLLFFFAVLVLQVIDGTLEYRATTDAVRKQRIAKLMTSFLVVYVSATDFLPMAGVDIRPIGYIPVISFIAFAWTTIQRHRFPAITAAGAAREILETMADALFVIDAEGRIRVLNDGARTLLGYNEADLLGRSIDALEFMASDQTITRTLRELSRRGSIRDQERLLRHSDGHPIDVSISISPVNENDVQEGAVVIARDIRERKRAEHELHEAMRHLAESNRELEDFAYVASHDLQEPLRKIQAFGDLLKSKHADALPEQARDYIDRMQSAARRMQILINDLLSFSRVTTKAQPFVHVELREIAREVAHDLEIRTQESQGQIIIGELPGIDADPLQMRLLMQNLLANALKFQRPDVPPVVHIDGAVENGMCRITVRDNGIGFEEKYAERIFTMFERLHGRAAYEGTGIGLAICRKIAHRHGGEITAMSTPGEGSTFVVMLPAAHHPVS
jgi:PAS domain S-box-containing protein